MKKLVVLCAIIALVLAGCGSPAPEAAPTAQPSAVPPTAVPPTEVPPTEVPPTAVPPTDIPAPTESPAMTQMMTVLETLAEDGRLSSTDGELIEFNDYSADNNQLVYFNDAVTSGVDLPANFVYSGHFSWSSAAASDDPSGCGLIFAGQENGSHYALFLDQDQIFFLRSDASSGNSKAWILGKAAGSGRVSFGNPAEADFVLLVNGNHSYVYVDGNFIGQYDLVKDSPTAGTFGFSVISGTAKDYGVHCEITNSAVWTLK